MKLLIVSGRSGSGKSTALHKLEDGGFYCVDNLPAGLLPELVKQALKHDKDSGSSSKIAAGIDARNVPSELSRFPELIEKIPEDVEVDIIYLDANNTTLMRRFSETRRKHPLSSSEVSLQEAITSETSRLAKIATMADIYIDTSDLNLHELREIVTGRVLGKTTREMSLLFQSFGFKRQIPIDADFVFDVRCLPNPYWNKELRKHSGLDKPVVEFLEKQPEVTEMIADITAHLEKWLPEFIKAQRSYTTIAIGCTGGHHRSVYITNALYQHFQKHYLESQIRHRDLDK